MAEGNDPATPIRGEDGKWHFKAAGVDREFTDEEMVKYAQQGLGADAKWREADEKDKAASTKAAELEARAGKFAELEERERLMEIVRHGNPAENPDDAAALQKLAKSLDIPDETINAMMNEIHGGSEPAGSTSTPTPRANPADAALATRMRQFFAKCDKAGVDPAEAVFAADKRYGEDTEVRAKKIVQTFIDKDPVLGIMAKNQARRSTILNDVYPRVERRVKDGKEPFSQATIEAAIAEANALVTVVDEVLKPGTPEPSALGGAPPASGLQRLHRVSEEPRFETGKGPDSVAAFADDMLAFKRHEAESDELDRGE